MGYLEAIIERHNLIWSWHVADSILDITLGMHRWVWPHSYEWSESKRYFYEYLTTFIKPTSYLHFLPHHFQSFCACPGMPDHIHSKWLNKFVTSINVCLSIKMIMRTYHFASFSTASPPKSKLVTTIHPSQYTQIQLHTSTRLWDIAVYRP